MQFCRGASLRQKAQRTRIFRICPVLPLQKKARYPAPMEDLARALGDILNRAEELNLETDGYSIWGSSAGGHLAASFGTEAMGYAKYGLPKPGALVLCYPVVTMGEKTHLGSRNNLLGEAPEADMIALASVERQITPAYPPTFVWCGDADHNPWASSVFFSPGHRRDGFCQSEADAEGFRQAGYCDPGLGFGEEP